MRISRIFLVPILIVILAPFAFVRDGVTDAASTSEAKWPTPASSVAKKNPIAPKQASLVAGQKMYLKHCALCHGRAGMAMARVSLSLALTRRSSLIRA